ncbi:MAG TPA: nitrite reductase small subunit NirD [Candidatus Sulfotelmatobacter sp.]|nr:nitrite reductase small subunit NirD [Candidatus Sulfotelmatobacter sp.]
MNQSEPLTNRWVRIAGTDAIPLREGRAVQIAGHEIAVFNLGDRFLAVENKCPHRGGPLADGIISGSNVVCPLHAWKIDLASGEVLNQAATPQCIKTFATRVEDGVLLLEIPVVATATTHLSPDCLVSISHGSYLTRTASREV